MGIFKQNLDISVSFLKMKVKTTKPENQDPALCALQLLYEINTELARNIIINAQKHPNEVVSITAKQMISNKQDLLWGFRNYKTDAQ